MKNTKITLYGNSIGIRTLKKKKNTKLSLFTLEFTIYLGEFKVLTEKTLITTSPKRKKKVSLMVGYDIYTKSVGFLYVGKNTT